MNKKDWKGLRIEVELLDPEPLQTASSFKKKPTSNKAGNG